MPSVPDKPSLEGLEEKWDAVWESDGTYRFDRTAERADVYSIDTPPPTVSGSLHLGTVFGYVQFDSLARFQRMRGQSVFFPMGWDDNGLPTERRVQNHYSVRCDPTLPYGVEKDAGGNDKIRLVSRPRFIELCHELTLEDEKGFETVFRDVGMSVDWTLTYATISDESRRASQRAFLRNLGRGEAYASEAPTMWDVDFQTAVAQAEVEDRPTASTFNTIAFHRPDGEQLVIETTRPELLPSCVAVVVHPEDGRYAGLVGQSVRTPVFGIEVPIVTHRLADPEKGSGAAMICTFGDATDVIWWRELDLPTRSVIQRNGRLQEAVPEWLEGGPGADVWAELAGKTTKQARTRIVDLLRESGELLADPRPIEHEVKYYEKGDRPLEIVTSRQWYIRNGARDEARRQRLLDDGKAMQWHPDFMRVRFEHWVGGLTTDWLISRQRYFGVPIPVWYRVGAEGETLWDEPILPDESILPIDPQADTPPGFEASQRGQAGGFVGDLDIMDTWATSSLTPQIAGRWEDDPDLFHRMFPMDLRPQGPEIIRTWLFSTLLRSELEHDSLPWHHASINGWILDPDRKKMSKSKGNVVTPAALIQQHGADGLRYWACSAGPGTDTAVDEAKMKVGRRVAIKLLNASKFALNLGATAGTTDRPTAPLDTAMLADLAAVTRTATASFAGYQGNQALERAETFFWHFCDDYLELVKARAYSETDVEGAASARAALAIALSTVQRLFAPFLPFAAEETWSWWQEGSVHQAAWPDGSDIAASGAADSPVALDVATEVLHRIRKAKTEAKRSMRAPVARLVVTASDDDLAALRLVQDDVVAAGAVESIELITATGDDAATAIACTVELAPEPPPEAS